MRTPEMDAADDAKRADAGRALRPLAAALDRARDPA
jgi:hypothetical protein